MPVSTSKTRPDSTDLVRSYLHEIGQVPLLTHDEEIILGKQVQRMNELIAGKAALEASSNEPISIATWAQEVALDEDELNCLIKQGQQAKQKMIRANLRLVVSVAKKYLKRNMEFLDLIQEGSLGLERGVDKFDPTKGYRFSTYAYWWIRQAMTRAIAQQTRTIRLPIHIVEKLNKIKKIQRDLSQQLGRQATPQEIAAALDMETEKVKEFLRLSRPALSIDLRVGDEQDTSMIDLLEDDKTITPNAYVNHEALCRDIRSALASLSPQEQDVLKLRFGLEDGQPLTLAKIGDKLNLSRERIRRLQNTALKYIREHHSSNLQEHLAS